MTVRAGNIEYAGSPPHADVEAYRRARALLAGHSGVSDALSVEQLRQLADMPPSQCQEIGVCAPSAATLPSSRSRD